MAQKEDPLFVAAIGTDITEIQLEQGHVISEETDVVGMEQYTHFFFFFSHVY